MSSRARLPGLWLPRVGVGSFGLRLTRRLEKLGGTMKFRISLLLLTFALAMSSTLMAHAGACSNSTIKGTYAFTIRGQFILPNGSTLLIDGLAKTTFDGKGNLTQLNAVAV